MAGEAARAEMATLDSRRHDFRRLALQARADLDAIYHDASLSDGTVKRAAKAERFGEARADHAALKAGPWQGFTGDHQWFANANNASLGVHGGDNDPCRSSSQVAP